MTLRLGSPLPPDSVRLTAALERIRASGRWTNDGPLATELELRFAAREGAAFASAVSSGTTALTVALLALDLPPGAEVVTSPLTFRATAMAIEAAGLSPVFAAVDPESLTLDALAVERALSPKTGAILPVHLFGLPVDAAVDAVAADRGLPLVFDAAHAFGAGVAGRGTATAYSLHATKLLHTGEGGMIATDDPTVASRVRRIRNFGIDDDHDDGPGVNAKLSEVAAAVGLAMWDDLDAEIDARRRVRDAYAAAIASSTRVRHHGHGFDRALLFDAVRCEPGQQSAILDDLAGVDVVARRFPALSSAGGRFATARLVGATREQMSALSDSLVALPIHGRITAEQLAAVCAVLAR